MGVQIHADKDMPPYQRSEGKYVQKNECEELKSREVPNET